MKTKMNKKAQLGLDTVKFVMIAFLVLSVLAVSMLLVLPELRDVVEGIDEVTIVLSNVTTASVINETTAAGVGWSAQTDALITTHVASAGLTNCALTITSLFNSTGADPQITSNNYTISGCNIVGTGIDPGHAGQAWNITGSYTYSVGDTRELVGNTTQGVRDFFDNTSTIFAILVVVVIILAIAIIIAVVSRFGGGGGIGRAESGGGKGSFGSDTVMGV